MAKWNRALRPGSTVGLVALGAVALFTVPAVRKAVRSGIITAAVGVLKLADGARVVGSKIVTETGSIVQDAQAKLGETVRDAVPMEVASAGAEGVLASSTAGHEVALDPAEVTQTDAPPASVALRNAVVQGVATTLSAADIVTDRAKRLFNNRNQLATEVGALGEDSLAPHPEATSPPVLPPHLLPVTSGTEPEHPTRHAGKLPHTPLALLNFSDDVAQVGASLKSEYRHVADVVDDVPQ